MSKTDTSILEVVIPRLIPNPDSEAGPFLGLEITDGPYTGTIFSFHKFVVLDEEASVDGKIRTQFETRIHRAYDGFTGGEDFDAFCADVLVAWLGYLSDHTEEMRMLLETETKGIH